MERRHRPVELYCGVAPSRRVPFAGADLNVIAPATTAKMWISATKDSSDEVTVTVTDPAESQREVTRPAGSSTGGAARFWPGAIEVRRSGIHIIGIAAGSDMMCILVRYCVIPA